MARTCTVCGHPRRADIDRALVGGAAFRNIAERFGLSATSVFRHKAEHLPADLVTAHAAEDVRRALDVVQQLKVINGSSLAILRAARDGDNHDVALKAIDRIQRQIELQAKLLGELDERPQVNVLVSPEWRAVRATLLVALAPYPEARAAVAGRLAEVEGAG